MSQEILEAARSLYLRLGVRKTTMADIAAEAGLSRATLYRRYATHEQVFLAVLEIESQEMAADAAIQLARVSDPVDRVVEGVLFCLEQVPLRPLHRHFFSGETALWSADQLLGSDALRRMARALVVHSLSPHAADASPTHAGDDDAARAVDDLTEWILRLLLSFVAWPSERSASDADDTRRFLRTMLAPTIEATMRRLDATR